MIAIQSFAKRICEANHNLSHGTGPYARSAPCAEHVQIARQSWGLIQASGAKTLGAILSVAIEEGVRPEFTIQIAGIVEESHMEGGVRVIEKVRVTSAEVRHERLLESANIDLTETVTIPHG